MTYTITKEFAFSASHQLDNLPPEHQCARLHGHNYRVVVELECPELTEEGWVYDYGALGPFKTWLDEHLDHRHLNDVLPHFGPPTAERLAKFLGEVLALACDLPNDVDIGIGVSETPKTWAWWRER